MGICGLYKLNLNDGLNLGLIPQLTQNYYCFSKVVKSDPKIIYSFIKVQYESQAHTLSAEQSVYSSGSRPGCRGKQGYTKRVVSGVLPNFGLLAFY